MKRNNLYENEHRISERIIDQKHRSVKAIKVPKPKTDYNGIHKPCQISSFEGLALLL
jgi:hypothetical protein